VERFEAATGPYIHSVYGLTETTSPSHATPLGTRSPVDTDTAALACGLPLPSTHCKVVDVESREEVPSGEVGELARLSGDPARRGPGVGTAGQNSELR